MDIHIDIENRWIASPLTGPAGLSEIPLFPYSAEIPVVVFLEDAAGDPAAILGTGWTANLGISTTADETDTPEVWVPSTDVAIDESAQTLTCLADCLTTAFKTAVTGQSEPVDAWLGIKLYASGETQPRYCYRVKVRLDNIVYDEGVDPPEEPLSDYYSKSEITALLAALKPDLLTSPTGTTSLGLVYRNNAGSWVAADPDTDACETCELFCALGTSVSADGVTASGVVTNPAWSWTTIGALLWLGDDGAITETVPDAVSDAGRVARPVGWVRSATSIRFDGHLLGSSYEGAS